MASIHKIGDQYRVRFFLWLPDGRKVDRSRRVDKMGQARELKALADVLEMSTRRQNHSREDLELWRRHGLITPVDVSVLQVFNDGRKTIRQAADEYIASFDCCAKEKQSRLIRVEHLVELLKPETEVGAVRHLDGEAIKTALRANYKAVSVNKHLQDLKRIFTLQLAQRTIDFHPFGVLKGLKIPESEKIEHVALDHQQIIQVIAQAVENDKKDPKKNPGDVPLLQGQLTLFLLLLFGCGMRRKEALAAKLENIDWKNRSLKLTVTKTNKEREVGLGQRLFELLKNRKGQKGYILPQLHPTSVSRAISLHFLRCGIKMRLHDTRHTYTTRLLDLGIKRHDAMARTGHKTSRMLDHYTHPELGEIYEDEFPFMHKTTPE